MRGGRGGRWEIAGVCQPAEKSGWLGLLTCCGESLSKAFGAVFQPNGPAAGPASFGPSPGSWTPDRLPRSVQSPSPVAPRTRTRQYSREPSAGSKVMSPPRPIGVRRPIGTPPNLRETHGTNSARRRSTPVIVRTRPGAPIRSTGRTEVRPRARKLAIATAATDSSGRATPPGRPPASSTRCGRKRREPLTQVLVHQPVLGGQARAGMFAVLGLDREYRLTDLLGDAAMPTASPCPAPVRAVQQETVARESRQTFQGPVAEVPQTEPGRLCTGYCLRLHHLRVAALGQRRTVGGVGRPGFTRQGPSRVALPEPVLGFPCMYSPSAGPAPAGLRSGRPVSSAAGR